MTLRKKIVSAIFDFQQPLGAMGDLEDCRNQLPDLVKAASEEWIDVLIDIARDSPDWIPDADEEGELFESDLADVTAGILRRFPDGVQKVAPLLENDETRVLAFNILAGSCLPEALDLLEPFVRDLQTLSTEEVCHLASALAGWRGERNRLWLTKIRNKVPDCPLPQSLAYDSYMKRRPIRTLYALIENSLEDQREEPFHPA